MKQDFLASIMGDDCDHMKISRVEAKDEIGEQDFKRVADICNELGSTSKRFTTGNRSMGYGERGNKTAEKRSKEKSKFKVVVCRTGHV